MAAAADAIPDVLSGVRLDEENREVFVKLARALKNHAVELKQHAKQKNVPEDKKSQLGFGDVWTWVAIDPETKLVVSHLVGLRNAEWANAFMKDVAGRLANRVQLTTDGQRAYLEAVDQAFGADIDYAMLVKMYGQETPGEARYSPAKCIGCERCVEACVLQNDLPREIPTRYRADDGLSGRRYTSIQRIYTLVNVIVSNDNVRAGVDNVLEDSDRDGIPDEEELVQGTSRILWDSDGDACSDLLEMRLQFDPLSADCGCIPPITDEDSDGLNSCEELWLGTARDIYDSDRDGIPDGAEFKEGLNPLGDDRLDDLDFDGISNGDEVQRHTNPEADDPVVHERWAYDYSIVERGVDDVSRRCYDFQVSNVQFRPVMETPDQLVGTNLVRVYFAEVPWDDPEDYPIYRMAEFPVPVSNIPGTIRISPDDFDLFD